MEKVNKEHENSNSSSDSQELAQIPLNKSMILADNATNKNKGGKKKKRNKKKKKGAATRGRSNTTEEQLTHSTPAREEEMSIRIDEDYLISEAEPMKGENNLTKDSTDNNSEETTEKKSSLFISR